MAVKRKSEHRDSDKNSVWYLIGTSTAVKSSCGNHVILLLVQFMRRELSDLNLKSSWNGCEIQPPSRWNARDVRLGLWVPLPFFTGSRRCFQAPEDRLASPGLGRFLREGLGT